MYSPQLFLLQQDIDQNQAEEEMGGIQGLQMGSFSVFRGTVPCCH